MRSKRAVVGFFAAVAVAALAMPAMGAIGFTDLGTGSAGRDFSGVNFQPSAAGIYRNLAHTVNDSRIVGGELANPTTNPSYFYTDPYVSAVGGTTTAAPAQFYDPSPQTFIAQVNNNGDYAWTKAFKPYLNSTALNVPSGGLGNAYGMSNNGDVVGQIYEGTGFWHSAVWAAGGTSYVYVDPTAFTSNNTASDINDLGQIIGHTYGITDTSGFYAPGYVTAPSSTTAVFFFDELPGCRNMVAESINNSGRIVGAADNTGDTNFNAMSPFVWVPTVANGTTGTGRWLETVSGDAVGQDAEELRGHAYAINEDGIAVGYVSDNTITKFSHAQPDARAMGYIGSGWFNGDEKAFIWDTDTNDAVYLESLLSQAEQDAFHLLFATDINNDLEDDGYDITVTYKLETEITSLGFGSAPIYSALMTNVEFGTGPALVPGDCDGDGDVDLTDLAILASNYGAVEPPALEHGDGDFDDDGDVDLTDLAILANNWGFGTMTAVPEPATMGLLSLGALAVIRRRRA